MKDELQAIISGKSQDKYGAIIQAITGYLIRSERTGKMAKDFKQFKKQETEVLKHFFSKVSFPANSVLEVVF